MYNSIFGIIVNNFFDKCINVGYSGLDRPSLKGYNGVNNVEKIVRDMGHRRHSQPRRGSLAYLPRGRAKSMEARIRAWPNITSKEPRMMAHVGFKAGCIQVVSIDDRKKTPNHGKQLVSLGTVLATPPITVVGLRGYSKNTMGCMQDLMCMQKTYQKILQNIFH
ncbi:MAG: ribosomal protein L3 [Cenarchaeum symbiont of Oopsacas minuta]|nr:ribosomal protein L3 [Cenarchaeum symbiont of Oopsacas minuta]